MSGEDIEGALWLRTFERLAQGEYPLDKAASHAARAVMLYRERPAPEDGRPSFTHDGETRKLLASSGSGNWVGVLPIGLSNNVYITVARASDSRKEVRTAIVSLAKLRELVGCAHPPKDIAGGTVGASAASEDIAYWRGELTKRVNANCARNLYLLDLAGGLIEPSAHYADDPVAIDVAELRRAYDLLLPPVFAPGDEPETSEHPSDPGGVALFEASGVAWIATGADLDAMADDLGIRGRLQPEPPDSPETDVELRSRILTECRRKLSGEHAPTQVAHGKPSTLPEHGPTQALRKVIAASPAMLLDTIGAGLGCPREDVGDEIDAAYRQQLCEALTAYEDADTNFAADVRTALAGTDLPPDMPAGEAILTLAGLVVGLSNDMRDLQSEVR